jgi:cytochrome P450
VSVPVRAMNRDKQRYPDAHHFDGRRFLKNEEDGLSYSSDSWLIWGVSRITWYPVPLLRDDPY